MQKALRTAGKTCEFFSNRLLSIRGKGMKITIIETLAYTIEVKDVDRETAIVVAKETYERGDISLDEMARCGTEYNDGEYDSVDMTLDKDGNNLEILEEYR